MRKRQFFYSLSYVLFAILLFSNSVIFAQTTIFTDDFDSGTGNWVLTGAWGGSTTHFHSGTTSLSENPTGNYSNMQSTSAIMQNSVDLSGYLGGELSFWAKYDIEAAFDFVYLEISKDNGSTFLIIDSFTDVSNLWSEYTYDIGSFAGYSQVKVRFRLFSDQAVNGDGIYIDDFKITALDTDNSAPLIVHTAPEYYEGTLGDYTVSSEITDPSGIASANVYYYVDGVGPNSVVGQNVSGDNYNFVIPTQNVGSNVAYKIEATDNAVSPNKTDTSTVEFYRYISGSYLSYDDAAVDALDNINGLLASAVKITVPSGQYGFLRSALIRNYTDNNNVNDDMLFHVWDDNNGVPGTDLITPFLVTPEATLDDPLAFTRIDLRSYSPELDDLTEDFYIGITVPQNTVNLLVSNNANGRSFRFDGTSWSSYIKAYEFRAIININSSPLPVELTSFSAQINESMVELGWETATEVNNYGFEIERLKAIEGEQNTEWKNLGFVKGSGNSNSPKFYSFEDNSLIFSGVYKYRLKQIDIDGKFEYSNLVEVSVSAPNSFSLGQNYPNPFNPSTTIRYAVSNISSELGQQNVVLKIYDVLGKEIATLVNENQTSGNYEVNFDASEYSSGLYFYTLKTNNFSQTRKMILMK